MFGDHARALEKKRGGESSGGSAHGDRRISALDFSFGLRTLSISRDMQP
jgi:hypothetical protein